MFIKFIKRPVLAISISIGIIFIGLLSINTLPVSQFPDIAPPRVNVFIAFPGASAKILVESALIPLERAINGVQGMQYIISDATSAGEGVIQVVFEPGTDPNAAVVNVKTRVDQVMNNLPPLVQREGIIITPIQPSMLMYLNIYSTNKNIDEKFLYNYAYVHVLPELQRISGMGRSVILGSRTYSMRVWLKPDRMRAYNVSVEEVMDALSKQSMIGRPGRIGQSSGKVAQSLEFVLSYKGRFSKPEEYEDIIIRATPDGQILKLKDIASVELGSEFIDIYSKKDTYSSVSIVLKQNFGSNAMKVIEQVKEKMKEMKPYFPPGVDYEFNYDVSKFVDASIDKVLHTLVEAFILVALVVLIFLGDFRSTLVPTLAVPISLIGAFAFMQLFGLSINLITLFALVLAIGIVVDNAIVVVEAVHAKMEEKQVTPLEAVKMMIGEISGAIIAITLIMACVFVPVSFLKGPVGIFYRQFSITMASSIILSGISALTLTPILSAMLLKPHHHHKKKNLFDRFIDQFNALFQRFTLLYTTLVRKIITKKHITISILLLFIVGIIIVGKILPSGFIPNEDQGQIYAILQTPPGTTLERTYAISQQLQKIAKQIPEVQSVTSLAGYEILTEGRGSNAGTCLINLKDWSERKRNIKEIIEELEEKTKNLGAKIEYFEPPAVPGYGSSDGFSLRLIDRNGTASYQEFEKVNNAFMQALRKRKEIGRLFTFYAANYPQYELVIDNQIAMQKGVSIGRAMEDLSVLLASTYEQGFIRFNTFFKVYVQSAPEYRRIPSDILNLYTKNEHGEMVPYSSFMKLVKTQGPNEITRFNLYNSSTIRGAPAEGVTTGEAMNAIYETAKKTLPVGYDIAWEGLSYDEARRGNEALYIFAIVVFFVYLVLSSQYESFIIPFAVLLSLPPGIFGSFLLLKIMGLANDIYAQIALIMLIGLLGKNAILIVEYAIQKHQQGLSIADAAIEGAKIRLRPILMTSFAFIAGLIPLIRATGPAAVGSKTIGASALGGMLLGTIFGIIVVPGLYYIFGNMAEGRKLIKDEELTPLSEDFVEHQSEEFILKKLAQKLRLFVRKNTKANKNKVFPFFVSIILSALLSSCILPKINSRTENKQLPKQYTSSAPSDSINSSTLSWKKFFKDSTLIALIDSALKKNQELNIINQEIEILKNEARIRKGEYLPFVGIGIKTESEWTPRYTRFGAIDENIDILPGHKNASIYNNYFLGPYVSWEIDIWKKLRNARKSALAKYLGSTEGRNFAITNLVAEIAMSYYELMALDNLLYIIQQNIAIQSNVLEIIQKEKSAGKVSQLAVNRFQAQLLNTQNMQYKIKQQIIETENRMHLLTGQFPTPILRQREKLFLALNDSIYTGIPLQLLQNRPDIRQAAWEIEAAKWNLKSKKAAFYPSLGLNGMTGINAFKLALLPYPESFLYSAAADILFPLINRNALKAMYYMANAQLTQQTYQYERTVLNAYLEVLNYQAKIKNYTQSFQTKNQEVEILIQSINVANNLFKSARADYMEVLLTQREALISRMELIDIKLEQLKSKIGLYKALGGGWR